MDSSLFFRRSDRSLIVASNIAPVLNYGLRILVKKGFSEIGRDCQQGTYSGGPSTDFLLNRKFIRRLTTKPEVYPHLVLTEIEMKIMKIHKYIWSYENIKINLFFRALIEKTHILVIPYCKIDHFCPLISSFHPFFGIWPNVWVWNSLLPSFYHLLVQLRHARSLFFPLGTNDLEEIKPRCRKYAVCFWKSRVTLGQKLLFNHSYWCQKGKKSLLACLTCTNKW